MSKPVKSGGVGHSAAMVRRVNKFKDPGNVMANRITALENERNRRSRENEQLRRKAILLRVALRDLLEFTDAIDSGTRDPRVVNARSLLNSFEDKS